MQKLALFNRLQTLVLHLQSENDEDIHEGLKHLTTLTQLRNLTLRASVVSLDPAKIFFESLISLKTLDLQLYQKDKTTEANPLSNLTSLESLSITAVLLTSLQFLNPLQKLKHFLLVGQNVPSSQFTSILGLTELTNLALIVGFPPKRAFFQKISALTSLQMFVMESVNYPEEKYENQLTDICLSLPKLHTLVWNSSQPTTELPIIISKLENLRVLRLRSSYFSREILATLPYLEIQTDEPDTLQAAQAAAARLREDLRAKNPNMSEEDLSSLIPKITSVKRQFY